MTDPDKLKDLIARIVAATEGSRDLDLEILNACGERQWKWHERDYGIITHEQYGPGAVGNPVVHLEHFSDSLDAAVTLIPDGALWEVAMIRARIGEFRFFVQALNIDMRLFEAECDGSAALCVCATALKARLK